MNEKLESALESIRETAAEAGGLASDAAYSVGKKASCLLSTAKLNVQAAELRSKIDEALRALGAMLYATHAGDPTPSEDLQEKLEEIDRLKARYQELREALGKADKAQRCPVCGAAKKEGDLFCRECGSKL